MPPNKPLKFLGNSWGMLGNASSHIVQERRHKIAEHLNMDVQDLVKDESQFIDVHVVSMVFGKNFIKTVKKHVDAIKSLRKPTSSYSSDRPHSMSRVSASLPHPTAVADPTLCQESPQAHLILQQWQAHSFFEDATFITRTWGRLLQKPILCTITTKGKGKDDSTLTCTRDKKEETLSNPRDRVSK